MTQGQEMSGKKVSDIFSDEDLARIETATHEAEKNTSGEIRVVMRPRYSEGLEGDMRAQVKHEFEKYGLGNTRDKTGVLVLLVLEARKFMVWGDEGIHSKVPQGYWDVLAVGMTAHFKESNYVLGICEVVEEVGKRLAQFFPRKTDDVNELSDKPILEDE